MVADFPEASEDGAHARFTPRFLVSVVVADMKPPPSRWNMPAMNRQFATDRPLAIIAAGVIAIIFGTLTIVSGWRALFGGVDMGAVVPFVLRFNFVAGFAYVLAGIGLWRRAEWARTLSAGITLATAAVFVLFLWHVWSGGAYEERTMGAMTLRLVIWSSITVVARCFGYRQAE